MAKLIVKMKDKTLEEVSLDAKTTVTLGRDPSNKIRLDNLLVSRFHAKIYKQGLPFYIEDLKSKNGVFINGKKITWKQGLNHRDEIMIGKHTVVFMESQSDQRERNYEIDDSEEDEPINPDMTVVID
ncbi:MAG: FHA domain-containing protein [Thermodesulfobacteriota bacterium]